MIRWTFCVLSLPLGFVAACGRVQTSAAAATTPQLSLQAGEQILKLSPTQRQFASSLVKELPIGTLASYLLRGANAASVAQGHGATFELNAAVEHVAASYETFGAWLQAMGTTPFASATLSSESLGQDLQDAVSANAEHSLASLNATSYLVSYAVVWFYQLESASSEKSLGLLGAAASKAANCVAPTFPAGAIMNPKTVQDFTHNIQYGYVGGFPVKNGDMSAFVRANRETGQIKISASQSVSVPWGSVSVQANVNPADVQIMEDCVANVQNGTDLSTTLLLAVKAMQNEMASQADGTLPAPASDQ